MLVLEAFFDFVDDTFQEDGFLNSCIHFAQNDGAVESFFLAEDQREANTEAVRDAELRFD